MPEESKKERAEPLFRRAKRGSGMADVLKKRRQKRYRERKRRDRELSKGIVRLRAVEMRFIGELVRNGGSPGAAAAALGLNRQTGVRWMSRPEVAIAYNEHVQAMGRDLEDWKAAAVRAKRTLEILLDSPDERVRADVAKYITNRHFGAVPAKLEAEITHHNEPLTEIQMAAALSLVPARGITFEVAKQYVRDHPEDVAEWWAQQQKGIAPRTRQLAPGRTNGGEGVGEDGSGGDRVLEGDFEILSGGGA